jgi:hypothetical protein
MLVPQLDAMVNGMLTTLQVPPLTSDKYGKIGTTAAAMTDLR